MPGEDFYSWSVTADNNGNADTGINWLEHQARASVNNSARAMMAALAKQRHLRSGNIQTTGSPNAYAFTSGVGYTSIPQGLHVTLALTFTNTGPATLNMDGIGAVAIRTFNGTTDVSAGDLVVNTYAEFTYNGSVWIVTNTGTPKLSSTGGTITGNVTIASPTPSLTLTAPVSGQGMGIISHISAPGPLGGDRWIMLLGDSAPEGGPPYDDGSNFSLFRVINGAASLSLGINRQTNRTAVAALTSQLDVTAASVVATSGVFAAADPGGNAAFGFSTKPNNTTVTGGYLLWEGSSNNIILHNAYAPATGQRIVLSSSGRVALAGGLNSKQGTELGYGSNAHNFYYQSGGGNIEVWVDNSNVGNLAGISDYRIKKDVVDLPSTWDTVKALHPIKYTHADYTVPGGSAPFVKADDVERWGFFAHELQDTLVGTAATGVKDDPVAIQSPNWPPIVAALTKALQEAMTRIEALEAASLERSRPDL